MKRWLPLVLILALGATALYCIAGIGTLLYLMIAPLLR